jgi:hypothetical protein
MKLIENASCCSGKPDYTDFKADLQVAAAMWLNRVVASHCITIHLNFWFGAFKGMRFPHPNSSLILR